MSVSTWRTARGSGEPRAAGASWQLVGQLVTEPDFTHLSFHDDKMMNGPFATLNEQVATVRCGVRAALLAPHSGLSSSSGANSSRGCGVGTNVGVGARVKRVT